MSVEISASLPAWQSPYQEERFFKDSEKVGFDCHEITIDGLRHFFYKSGDEYVAWEVSNYKPKTSPELPVSHIIHCLSQVDTYDNIDWREIAYATVFMSGYEKGAEKYSRRFRRGLAKAQKEHVRHSIAETDQQIAEVLEKFKGYPERRGFYDYDLFRDASIQYLSSGLASVHAVYINDPEYCLLGGAVVLSSPTQVNLRFYTADRTNHNPGHFLIDSIIKHYFEDESIAVVDLSGINPPAEDLKLDGINEFKLQISKRVAGFSPIR